MQLDLLAVGAHPDDVELTCGATIIKCVKLGYSAGIVDLTAGELGTRGTVEIRAREAKAAEKILGVTLRENLHIPDGGIELNRSNILKLVSVIRRTRPRILLIPHSVERHPDHVHTHHLAREASYYSGLRKIPTTYKGKPQEPWRPHHCFHYMQWHEFTPSFIVDVTDEYDQRLAAIKAHRSQLYDPRSKDPQTLLSQKSFFDLLETRAKAYGFSIGAKYGEPFFTTDSVGIKDLFALRMVKG